MHEVYFGFRLNCKTNPEAQHLCCKLREKYTILPETGVLLSLYDSFFLSTSICEKNTEMLPEKE